MNLFRDGVIFFNKVYGAGTTKEKSASALKSETPPITDSYEPSEYSYTASDANCPPGG